MNRKTLPVLLVTTGLLVSCGDKNTPETSVAEYQDPLNSYEVSLVKKSALDQLLSLAKITTTVSSTADDSLLYSADESRAAQASSTSTSATSSIYSNYVIVTNTIASSSTTNSGIRISNAYETKSMIAVLANPTDRVKADGSVTMKYGLYEKSFYKASSAKEFGVTYQLLRPNFADEENLSYRWNSYLMSTYNPISTTNFSYFHEDSNAVRALSSSYAKTVVSNPVYPYDNTKSVTSINSNVSSLEFRYQDGNYRIASGESQSSTSYLSDYFGKALTNGITATSESSSSYEYGPVTFSGSIFAADEYWELQDSTPVLHFNSDTTQALTNISRDYQQTNGTDDFAFETTFTPTSDTTIYSLTNQDGTFAYSPNSFKVDPSITLQIDEETGNWTLSGTSSAKLTYRLLVVMSRDFSKATVTLSLA